MPTAQDKLFRKLAQTQSAKWGGSLMATITNRSSAAYDPDTGTRPAATEQSYTVTVAPPYQETRQGSIGTEKVTRLLVPAKSVEEATVTGSPSTPIAPGSGSKVVFSTDSQEWTVTSIEPIQSGEQFAAYILELTR